MLLVSWNVNGIRAVMRKGFTDFLNTKKPDILGLQEIKIDDVRRAEATINFKKYKEFWFPAKKPGYAGTCILVKNNLSSQILNYKQGIGVKKFDNEGRAQTLEFKDFYFVNNYFPNTGDDLRRLSFKEEFNSSWLKYIKKLELKKPVITCGDFNVAHSEIDLARPKNNMKNAGFTVQERAWADKFINSGLIDTFRLLHPKKIQYSWWTYRFGARSRNVGWRIDYFFISKKLKTKLKKAFIWDKIEGSDHCPVGINIY